MLEILRRRRWTIAAMALVSTLGCDLLPETDAPEAPQPVVARNLAAGLLYRVAPAPSEKYADSDGQTLTDGKYSSPDDLHRGWLGFDRGVPTVTIDLGSVHRVDQVAARFLSRPEADIHLPSSVWLSTSLDAQRWTIRGELAGEGNQVARLALEGTRLPARYVRLVLEREIWAFIDELEVFGAPLGDADADFYEPVGKVLVLTNGGEYEESRARLTNLLEGMGLPFDVLFEGDLRKAELAPYQLIVVAGSSQRALTVDTAGERRLIAALAGGVNVLWIGSGIWGTFQTPELPEAFGVRYVEQVGSRAADVAQARFTNLAGGADWLPVHPETVYRVEAAVAEVDGGYVDSEGRDSEMPFVTHYQALDGGGTSVYVSLPLLEHWKAAEAEDTLGRAEVLFKYLRRLTTAGTVGKHPVRDAREAVFMLRLEDYVPGGAALGNANRAWLIRMERLLELTRDHDLPLNIAVVPRYAHPFSDEFHEWDEADPAIATLRRQAQRAFQNGGSLIVHGYDHQNGEDFDDVSVDDWETWDEEKKQFLSLDEQRRITDSAFAEITRQWKIEPTIWETPHYTSDANTYRAASESGFLYFTEGDTKLFPNRQGYLNRAAGRLLNIPETAFYYPNDPGATIKAGRLKQQRLLPRIVRMNGLFLFFYHNHSVQQATALRNLLATARRFELWKPSMEDYARFWLDRDKVEVQAEIDPIQRRIRADVSGAFRGLTLSIRLPDGAAPAGVKIDGEQVDALSRRLESAWYVYPVLPDAERCTVLVEYDHLGTRAEGS